MSVRVVRRFASDTTIVFDGDEIPARTGEAVAAALLATGRWASLYCGMGACFACLVTVDGCPGVRACMERVRPGMNVETRNTLGRDGAH